jgi:pilus assembly protein CpaC
MVGTTHSAPACGDSARRGPRSRRSRHLGRRPGAFVAALVVYIIVILVAAPEAQQAPTFTPAAAATTTGLELATPTDIDLLVGRSTILNVGTPISRVSLTVPDVADAMVTSPGQLLIHGKTPGTISLFVWDKSGAIKTYEVTVRRDLSSLTEYLKQLFPGETISVSGSGKDIVLSGTVSSKYVMEKAADVAAGYVEKKENVVNLLKQQEGVASNQVMLRVRFAEVSRSALQELGASYIVNGFQGKWFGRATTQQFSAPDFDTNEGGLVFSDFLNIFVFNTKEGLGGVMRALQNKGLFQSLAEPNLISTNGKEASFLAGGEYPYPVVQPSSSGNSVTIQFKEFGVRLNFTPTVLGGDLINLKVRPEVSSLDFSNALTLGGFRVPAISTRRTETEVELMNGQTFAIAGLMNNTLNESLSKIPGIGDIPVLGLLFRSRAHQKNQTELVVMITPTIVKRGQMGVSEGLPNLVAPYMGRPDKSLPNPDAYVGSPRYPLDKKSSDNSAKPESSTASSAPAEKSTSEAQQPVASKPAAPPEATQPAAPESAPKAEKTLSSKEHAKLVQRAKEQEKKAAEAEARERAAADKRKAEQDKKAQEQAKAAQKKAEAQKAAQQKADADKAAQQKATGEKAAAEKRVSDTRAAEKQAADKRQADKIAKERAERAAVVAKQNEEAAKKQPESDQKRDKALAEAAAKLKAAQTAYEAELQKAKGGQ